MITTIKNTHSIVFLTVFYFLFHSTQRHCVTVTFGAEHFLNLFSVSLSQPLVLDQDCMTLCSRDLRLEKRTLFRSVIYGFFFFVLAFIKYQIYCCEPLLDLWLHLTLKLYSHRVLQNVISVPFCSRLDLVPINRSVGLKAKPTKPVTEVLRPVVAKYGLHLSDLVARIVSHPSAWLLVDRRT